MAARIERTHRDVGYGFTDYVITGSLDEVTEAVDVEIKTWPPAGYGTWFNWPPGKTNSRGEPITYCAPVEISPGVWRVQGHRQNSCE